LDPARSVVPRISEFFGIAVTMYYNGHASPHFHSRYSEHEGRVVLGSLDLLSGSLPPRASSLVRE
jgi:hypothetical protein